MLKAAIFYIAVFVVGTASMILAHKLDPQKPIRSAGTLIFEKRIPGTGAVSPFRFMNMLPAEAQDI